MGSSLNSSNAVSKRPWQPQDVVAGLASVILLTLAAAPWYQWYLAWIGLTPWLVAVGHRADAAGCRLVRLLDGMVVLRSEYLVAMDGVDTGDDSYRRLLWPVLGACGRAHFLFAVVEV